MTSAGLVAVFREMFGKVSCVKDEGKETDLKKDKVQKNSVIY